MLYKGYLDGVLFVESNSIPSVKRRLDAEEELFGWHCWAEIVRGRQVIRVKDYLDADPKWQTFKYKFTK